ncbi:MAG: hypothetical protein ACLFWL_10455 [Candidatus Brocadiia bacterium]
MKKSESTILDRRSAKKFLWLLVLLLLAFSPVIGLSAENGGPRGRNKRLFVVPRPGKIEIDGQLDDWDRSGGILSFAKTAIRDKQYGRTYAMYDKKALYIAGEVRDDSPMMNMHDPKANPDRAWDADCFQFRIYLKPQYPGNDSKFNNPEKHRRLAHLLLWYYTKDKQPNLQLRYSMAYILPQEDWSAGIVPHDLFDAAYRKWEDNKGYTFEYRIPWDVLSKKYRPKAGDITAAALQYQWSRADGLKQVSSAKDLERKPGFQFQTTDVWGKAIFAQRGNLPDVPFAAGDVEPPEPPLPLRFRYNLPEDGRVVIGLWNEDNIFQAHVVVDEPRKAGKVEEKWDGLGYHTEEPLPAGTYKWKGLYRDKLTEEHILSVHNAGTPPYKTDDNTGGWGADHGEPTTVESVGDKMLLAWHTTESGWGIIRTDLDGDKEGGIKHVAEYLAGDGKRYFAAGGHAYQGKDKVRVYDLADSRPMAFEGGRNYVEQPPLKETKKSEEENGQGAPLPNRVTGLAWHDGRIFVSYANRDLIGVNDDATGKLLKTHEVPSPGRLAIAPNGSLLALSAGEKAVRIVDGKAKTVVSGGLDEPQGIATDGEGNIYVSNQGTLQNVSVFAPDGTPKTTIGKKGGRPRVGEHDPEGMLEPGGIAIDAKSRLWVAETLDRPKRISVWDTETEKNVAEYFGASSYFGWAYMDPEHPDEVYCHGCLWKVDLDKRTKKLVSTTWRRTSPNQPPPPNPGGYAGHFRVVTGKNGAQFGWGMAGRSRGLVVYMREGNIYKPIAGMIAPAQYPALEEHWASLQEKWKKQRIARHRRPRCLLWQDKNDDQKVQVDETTVPPEGGKRSWCNWIGKDLTLWHEAGYRSKPVKFDGKRPVYDFTKMEKAPLRGGNANCASFWFDQPKKDGVYFLRSGKPHSLMKRTVDGKLLWSYGKLSSWRAALGKPAMTDGDLWGLTMPLGMAGQFTGASSYFNPYHIFTRDGLYVGMVMRTTRDGKGLGPFVTASETLTGQLVKPKGMERWFLLAGDQDGRITEIHGLDTVQRLPGGTYKITPDDVKKVTQSLQKYEAARAQTQPLFIERYPVSLERPGGGVFVREDENRAFRGEMAYDSDNVYFRYKVESPAPFINDAPDPQILFKGGNLIDVQMATNPDADPKRENPVPGDVRLLIGRRPKGDPIAVLFRPKVKGFNGDPIVLESPTGTESFDEIRVVKKVKLSVEETKTGFIATATVPREVLGWEPVSGSILRMDLGYIYGNKTGKAASMRSYWSNDSFTANVTDDIPHESRLEPDQWGRAIVE